MKRLSSFRRFEFDQEGLELDLPNTPGGFIWAHPIYSPLAALFEFLADFQDLNLKDVDYARGNVTVIKKL